MESWSVETVEFYFVSGGAALSGVATPLELRLCAVDQWFALGHCAEPHSIETEGCWDTAQAISSIATEGDAKIVGEGGVLTGLELWHIQVLTRNETGAVGF